MLNNTDGYLPCQPALISLSVFMTHGTEQMVKCWKIFKWKEFKLLLLSVWGVFSCTSQRLEVMTLEQHQVYLQKKLKIFILHWHLSTDVQNVISTALQGKKKKSIFSHELKGTEHHGGRRAGCCDYMGAGAANKCLLTQIK